ncbi:lactosylceramide 4-alpha-galactosyltransferase-like isoform X2 [Convolutriloba macropyga]|uniref:lactosylceramide 4-alpha-galactosyltransferase-like isoform X2 n=1 Tax=Convolutriloba macropyga TaxID=536237 RepID=UPI003F520D71
MILAKRKILIAVFMTIFALCAILRAPFTSNERTLETSLAKVTPENKCLDSFKLTKFSPKFSNNNTQMFFISVNSGSEDNSMGGREICSVESAIRNSDLPVKVLFTKAFINIEKNVHLCKLVQNYYPQKMQLFYINIREVFEGTPFYGIQQRMVGDKYKYRGLHLSDMTRSALIYKYGGFYADFDVFTLKSLRNVTNSVGSEYKTTVPLNCKLDEGVEMSSRITGGNFHFNAGSEFLLEVMKNTRKFFNPQIGRNHVGPGMFTRTAQMYLGLQDNERVPNFESADLSILPSFILPQNWQWVHNELYPTADRSDNYWEEMIRCSLTIHLAGSAKRQEQPSYNPNKNILSYLGPKICPVSFFDLEKF